MTRTASLGLRSAFAALAALALALGGLTLSAQPAHAAPSISVTVVDRPELSGVADSTYLTEVRVTGHGFQSIQNGFGGIYVLFGWAGSNWRPSQGGKTGSDYRYVYDDETNPVGYQLFVAFPGSSTEYAANGGRISADGSWSATMRIPGPRFQAYDRSGGISTVDCTQSQCGIMTIGAHGVVNANNESFTPISFTSIYGAGEGRQVIDQTGSPTGGAVAPTAIGGRPAIVPADLDAAALTEKQAGGVEVEVGRTRLTVTIPGADPEAWLGLTFYSDPLFAGWYQASSQGLIDVNLPENLPEGEHRLVVVSSDDELVGWASFEHALAEPAAEGSAEQSPVAVVEEAGQPAWLVAAVIGVGVLAIAAVAFFVIVLVRSRRGAGAAGEPAQAAPDGTGAAE